MNPTQLAGTDVAPPVTTPPPPCLAVMFVARLRPVNLTEYRKRADALMAKARLLPGFLGEDALRLEDNRLISISYWRDEESLRGWKMDPDHVATKRRGRESWYEYYELRIARVEQASSFRLPGEAAVRPALRSPDN